MNLSFLFFLYEYFFSNASINKVNPEAAALFYINLASCKETSKKVSRYPLGALSTFLMLVAVVLLAPVNVALRGRLFTF